jgi:hypothetical protein
MLLTLPHFTSSDYFQPRYEPVLREWEATGMPVKSSLDDFVSLYGEVPTSGPDALRWGINPGDAHPGPRATHFHAVMAADYLEQNWPQVLGPKETNRPHELAINDWLPFDLNVRKAGRHTFEFDYPATTDFMPRRPGEEPTALVALRYPLLVREIRLEGPDLTDSRVWVSLLDRNEAFDEDRWRELKLPLHAARLDREAHERSPDVNIFRLPGDIAGRRVTMIRFHLPSTTNNRRLKLTIDSGEGTR